MNRYSIAINLSINMDEPVLDSYQSIWMNRYSKAIKQYKTRGPKQYNNMKKVHETYKTTWNNEYMNNIQTHKTNRRKLINKRETNRTCTYYQHYEWTSYTNSTKQNETRGRESNITIWDKVYLKPIRQHDIKGVCKLSNTLSNT